MPKFTYAALDATGSMVEGSTSAANLSDARADLVERHLFPTTLEAKKGLLHFELTTEKLKKKELVNFTRQLAVFVRAGIPLTSALEVIADETEDKVLRRVLSGMLEDIRGGSTFSAAATEHREAFPDFYLGILQSAELTGRLDTALDNLAQYLQREVDTRSKVVAALSYPGVVMVMAFGTVAVLAGYVLPQFKPLFEELDVKLPLMTRAMLFVGTLFTDLWFIPFGGAAATVGLMYWLFKTKSGRPVKDRLVLKLPVISGIVNYAILERFCRILGAMMRAGVPLPDGLRVTTAATSNTVFRERLEEAQVEMLEGVGFTRPIIDTELFPGAAKQMFKVGEETGTLDEQLESAASYFDRELEVRIKRFTTMFEPIMIVFVGAIVGFVALALVQAMYGALGGLKEVQ